MMVPLVAALGGLALGAAAMYVVRGVMAAQNTQSAESRARHVVLDAEREPETVVKQSLTEVKDEIAGMRREAEEDALVRREELARQERRMAQAEEDLRAKLAAADRRASDLDDRDEKLHYVREQLEHATQLHTAQLERIAAMTAHEAREQLMSHIVDDAKRAAMAQVREIEQRAREEGEERARKIVTIAIQRVASEQTAESTVSVFNLPSDDMKGRIIGREGRNIRAVS
jgi:ribonuclease Y